MLTKDEVQKVIDLCHQQETIVGNTYHNICTQSEEGSPERNQAHHDYVATMQNIQNLYYKLSHDLTTSIASGDDLDKIGDATKDLQESLGKLRVGEATIGLGLAVLAAAFAITVAIATPNPATVIAATGAVAVVVGQIAAVINARKPQP